MLIGGFLIIQGLSLAVMLLFIHEYRRITFKHERLMESIEPGKKPMSTFHSNMIIWIYIIITIAILIFTSVYFSVVAL